MMEFKTKQEKFWAGDFGNEYIDRNSMSDEAVAAKISQWSQILKNIPGGGYKQLLGIWNEYRYKS